MKEEQDENHHRREGHGGGRNDTHVMFRTGEVCSISIWLRNGIVGSALAGKTQWILFQLPASELARMNRRFDSINFGFRAWRTQFNYLYDYTITCMYVYLGT